MKLRYEARTNPNRRRPAEDGSARAVIRYEDSAHPDANFGIEFY